VDPAPPAAGSPAAAKTALIVGAIGAGALLLFAAIGTFVYLSVRGAARDDRPRRRKRIYHDED
jgi:hypothetical protein